MKILIKWMPRVLSIIIIIFVIFLSFNGFVPLGTPLNNTLTVLVSMLPAIILSLVLVLAWFQPLAGGITYIIIGGAMSFFVHANVDELSFLTLSSPVLAVGVLFLLSHFYEKASSRTQ